MALTTVGARDGYWSASGKDGRKRLNFKAVHSRRRKRARWVGDLYIALRSEFDRLQSINVKPSPSFLACPAKTLTQNVDSQSSFASTVMIKGMLISSKISVR